MSRIVRIFRALKNNPKKSVFFSSAAALGINFLKGKYDDEQLMRAYCEEALKYGEQIQYLGEKDRHITVMLNPAANEGKSRRYFDKYCAPLLHLAGLKVAIVKTEKEGEAKNYMDIMDNTSAVVVAGGDGTLSEVVTGLMRRDDRNMAAKKLPLGLLPLGTKNYTAGTIFGFKHTPDVKHLAEASMAVIRNIKRPLDVMEVTPLQSDASENPKSVYAISEIEWSAYRDAEERKDKYWYWPFVKHYMTFVFSSYKDLSWKCDAELEYKLPCEGCSNCSSPYVTPEIPAPTTPPKRWWQAFLPKYNVQPIKQQADEEEDDIIEDRSSIINEECGKTYKQFIKDVSDLRISTRNMESSRELPGYSIALKTGSENVSSMEFIKEGWHRMWTKDRNHSQQLIIGEVTIRPDSEVIKDQEGNDRELNIDNENFEVRPMRIKAIPKALKIFAPNQIVT